MELQGMAPEVAKKFKYWQTRTIIASMIGYALFYFVRKLEYYNACHAR